MNKTNFILILAILCSVSVSAQFQVNSNGEAGVGTSPVSGVDFTTPKAKIFNLGVNTNPDDNFEMYVAGDIKLQAYYTSHYLYTEYAGNAETVLRPSTNNKGMVGLSNYAFRLMYTYDLQELSDKRQKENIQILTGTLGKVMQLQGVKYDIKKEYSYSDSIVTDDALKAKLEKERKNKIGFLAQDVQEIFPEVVLHDDSTDVYSINYGRLVPILVEAIKEQQLKIEELNSRIEDIESNKSIEYKSLSDVNGMNIDEALFQNSPNPFTENTIIKYRLSEFSSSARLNVYNLQGSQLKSYQVFDKGLGEIIIPGSEFSPGIYLYNLVVDGKEIGSKRMVLTD